MRLGGFPGLAINVIQRDWSEYKRLLLGVTACIFATVVFTLVTPLKSPDFAKGTLMGVLIGGGYGFAQFCFFNERQRGTLLLLLSLPVKPRHLVWAKYCSVFSMVLFSVNVPGALLRDFRFLLFANVVGLLLATICMAATVISDKPWAPQFPLWVLLILFIPTQRLLSRLRPNALEILMTRLAPHSLLIAAAFFLLIPLIVFVSAIVFQRRVTE